jgi:hypothetical protein
MKEKSIGEDDKFFSNLANTFGYGFRFENGDFESADSEVVVDLVPIAKCRD